MLFPFLPANALRNSLPVVPMFLLIRITRQYITWEGGTLPAMRETLALTASLHQALTPERLSHRDTADTTG